MSFSIIACVGKDGELGKDNQLVFHIKEDLAFFKNTTLGHPVIMGKNTFKSIGHALPRRKNFVITSHPEDLPEDVTPVTDLADFITKNQSKEEEIFIIGGASVYQAFLPYADTIYLTEVNASAPADTYFPKFNPDLYDKISIKEGSEQGLNYVFSKYTKKEAK